MSRARISDEDLLAILRMAGDPTIRRYRALAKEKGWPDENHFRRRFGSWNAALAAAGIEPRLYRSGVACIACSAPAYARGRCQEHYLQHMRSHGDTYKPGGRGGVGRYVFVQCEGRNVQEHRVVMAAVLGRRLLPGETVHHKGSTWDNRPEWLELRVSAHGQGWTIPEAVDWAREILRRYT